MRQKMITLCPTTYELAKKMPNFSSWVRMQLMKMHISDDNEGPALIGSTFSPCPNCGFKGDHYCKDLQMFVRGWYE